MDQREIINKLRSTIKENKMVELNILAFTAKMNLTFCSTVSSLIVKILEKCIISAPVTIGGPSCHLVSNIVGKFSRHFSSS